jgi:predicted transcriptional regulator
MAVKNLINSAIDSDESFRAGLKKAIKKHGNTKEFSKKSRIPVSTLYKILSGDRKDIRLSTLRQIVRAIEKLEGVEKRDNLVAVIASRPVLDCLRGNKIVVKGREFLVREYSATTLEEVIIAAIHAEREGARAVVCAPIVSSTVEKVVDVPVAVMMPGEATLKKSIEIAASKI